MNNYKPNPILLEESYRRSYHKFAAVADIDRNSYKGIGKPEPLREDLSGYWSWRIDEANILHVDEQYHETQKAACPSRMMRNGQAAFAVSFSQQEEFGTAASDSG